MNILLPLFAVFLLAAFLVEARERFMRLENQTLSRRQFGVVCYRGMNGFVATIFIGTTVRAFMWRIY